MNIATNHYTERQILAFLNRQEANCAKNGKKWVVVTEEGEFFGKTLLQAAVKAMNNYYKTRKSAFKKLTGFYGNFIVI